MAPTNASCRVGWEFVTNSAGKNYITWLCFLKKCVLKHINTAERADVQPPIVRGAVNVLLWGGLTGDPYAFIEDQDSAAKRGEVHVLHHKVGSV